MSHDPGGADSRAAGQPGASRRRPEQDEVELHYQPVVDLGRSEVVAVEAVPRWRRPESGPGSRALGAPDPLHHVARELDVACAQGARWHGHGLEVGIGVNASAAQVVLPGFLTAVERSLASSGLPASRLTVEVAEPAVADEAAVAAALTGITRLGVTAALDHFGTGLTSLAHLRRYPVRQLKIDASFVAGLGQNPDDRAVVSSILALGRAVGVTCVAQDVETGLQVAVLRELGCDRLQGPYFGAPVPAAGVPAVIDAAEARLAPAPPPSRRGQPEPVDEDVLAYMVRLHEAGASHHTIAASLNQMGSRHSRGRRWHPTAVARALADAAALHSSAGPA